MADKKLPQPKDTPVPNMHSVSTRPRRAPKGFTLASYKAAARTRRVRAGLLAVAFAVVAVLGGAVGGYVQSERSQSSILNTGLSGEKRIVSSKSQLINQISKTSGPSVVSITVNYEVASTEIDPFGILDGAPQQSAAAGTGVIISKSGFVLTNRHVVPEGTDRVSITLSDGTQLDDVSVVGRTNQSDSLDIAFLKINDTKKRKLVPAAIGDSGKVQVGDDVVAIGNALGEFQNSVTAGIISGFGRNVQAGFGSDSESLTNLIQTDAAINEGNSGGPLVNLNGQVIGINTAIAGGDAQNIGFSIPINDVKGLIAQVLETGKFERPYLGVRYVLVDPEVVDEYNLTVNAGAFIPPAIDPSQPSVLADSPADKGGLRERDIITKVDNDAITSKSTLISVLGKHRPGDTVTLTIIRDGKTETKRVTLGSLPAN